MKITIDIDCTPQEARTFFGLPDVEPLQRELIKQMRQRMMKYFAAADPEEMMKFVMPVGMQGFEQMQKMFWEQFGGRRGRGGKESSKE